MWANSISVGFNMQGIKFFFNYHITIKRTYGIKLEHTYINFAGLMRKRY